MPFRETFACLWCGRSHTVRDADDVEGWAQICPDCIGRAGENGFLRFRLKAALAERARHGATAPAEALAGPTTQGPPATTAQAPVAEDTRPSPAKALLHDEMVAYYAARAPEYDDWYLRRGRYSRGAIHDMAWQVDLDVATRWLDAQPIHGEIVELAAGTGWWSPLLAQKGELWAYDAADAPLEFARDRLRCTRPARAPPRRDAWAEPDRAVDAVFAGFWLSHVARPDCRCSSTWLGAGSDRAAPSSFIDSRADPQSGAADHGTDDRGSGVQQRRLEDGRSVPRREGLLRAGRAGAAPS